NEFFYKLKGNEKIQPVELEVKENENELDSDFIFQKYSTKIDENTYKIFVKITNIHCSACIWLNEKALSNLEGVKKAEINFASGRAGVEFDPSIVKISQIFAIIRSIGYQPILYSPSEKNIKQNNNLKDLLIRLTIAGFSFGNIMLFSVGLYSGYFSGIESEFKNLFHFVSWFFATPAYIYSGYPFLRGTLSSIKSKTLTMDFLIFTGISLAYFYSVYVTFSGQGEVYFDSVCMIYFFILVGKYFEERARVKASEEIESLTCKLPETVIKTEGNSEEIIPAELIQSGDILKALPGDRIPVDAELLSESANLDESIITGESIPLLKNKKDLILAGSIVHNQPIYYLAKTTFANSSLANLKTRLETALLTKPKIQLFTEKVANYFIKFVFLISIFTFGGWWYFTGNFELALVYTISVLIVACPCALGISVPTALVINHIINSASGIIVRNPNTMEALSKLDSILFDKTGTLTEGKFKILKNTIEKENIPLIYLTEKEFNHPVATSIVENLKKEFQLDISLLDKYKILSINNYPGKGVRSEIEFKGKVYYTLLGKKDFVIGDPEKDDSDVKNTQIHISINGVYSGFILLGDEIRKDSFDLIKNLKKDYEDIRIVSGDSLGPVKNVADDLQIIKFHHNLKPEDKLTITKDLQSQNKKVALVGDGINDSLSLAGADVGISHSNAEDISIDKSDIVIVSGNLLSISQLISNAKLTRRVIIQNITLSLLYNSIMLPLAISGNMLPVICSIFMTLSSLTVLINSISIKWRKEKIC
ncbi:MAG: cation-translocating P-type ATPase, partial [Leptospiraceae bacterium]|nr:cation-translocating P-type ATPase [Leptospiraceae bacterium]